ncbi:MAG: hypothetical protein A3G87_05855 [Omnitrophica bacterium RIFCSPLOWO2_12_FULL_50_11]|nr:MAG: hypothetical protein A3G87_05855 [Omnitrophica bacterium RIFCSPLOWO2_12_FULL_50_11]
MVNVPESALGGMQFESERESDEVNLELLWRIFRTRSWFIFTVVAMVTVLASIYALRLPNVYTARTKLLVQKVDPSPLQNPELMKPTTAYGDTYYLTRIEVMKSRPILAPIAERLNLPEHYGVETTENAAQILRGNLDAHLVRNTEVIEVALSDRDPKMAARIADAVAEHFARETWREQLFISDQVLKWFPEEGKILEMNSPIGQLRRLENDPIASLPSVMQDPVIGGIEQKQMGVDEEMTVLSARYTPEHPKMKELLTQAAYLQSEKKARIEKIISALKAGLTGDFTITNVKVIEPAAIPSRPSGPKRSIIVLASAAVSFAGSLLLVVFLHHLDQNISSEEDVRKIPATFLGYLPLISGLNGRSKNGAKSNLLHRALSDSRLIDSITNMRAALLFSMPAERSKRIMCTSAIPEEGKTTVLGLLGISLAQIGERILLIDADMRNPSLHQVFGLKNECGLSNCLIGSSRARDVIQVVEGVPGLHLMTAGARTPNPPVLLGSASIDRLIREIELDYHRIIFDVPPSLHIADGLILAGKVDGTVLVFRAGKVHQKIGRRMKEKIDAAGGVIIGGVINRADFKRLDSTYSRYYRQYTKYYHRRDGSKTEELSRLEPVHQ